MARRVATRGFMDPRLPPLESRARRRTTHGVAVLALLASAGYLTWRATTLGASAWLALPLFALEAHAALGLALFSYSLWDLDAVTPPAPVATTHLRVAVLIPTYNEPREVLLPTIAAAVALRPAHETWVLDDGERGWVAELAAALGARYLAREDHAHAKAGNINHSLDYVDADVVAVLDADHVAQPGLLTNTLGYFDDPSVALVQTPQDFYNVSSFEHAPNRALVPGRGKDRLFNEQALFYRAIQPGKNRWNAAFWAGTGGIVRVAALRDVGGIATDSVTEDIETTIRLHRRGWRTRYHNEVLARGLAAADAAQYQTQRLRWGTGAMQVLRHDDPLFGPGLGFGQRLAYASTLLGWFDAWRSLGFLLVPPAVLLTGAVPIAADVRVFVAVFVPVFLVQRLALALLSRGYAPQGMATVFEIVRMPANLRATLTVLSRRRRKFVVTPKGRMDDGRQRLAAPRLLWSLVVLTVVGVVAFVATEWFGWRGGYPVPAVAYGAMVWLGVNGVLLLAAIGRIRALRFAGERRAGERLVVHVPCLLDSRSARTEDVSLTGARLVTTEPGAREEARHLTLALGGRIVDVVAREVAREPVAPGRTRVRLEFEPGQDVALAQLALGLLGGVDERPPDVLADRREAAAVPA